MEIWAIWYSNLLSLYRSLSRSLTGSDVSALRSVLMRMRRNFSATLNLPAPGRITLCQMKQFSSSTEQDRPAGRGVWRIYNNKTGINTFERFSPDLVIHCLLWLYLWLSHSACTSIWWTASQHQTFTSLSSISPPICSWRVAWCMYNSPPGKNVLLQRR